MTPYIRLAKVREFHDLPRWLEKDLGERRFSQFSFASPTCGWVLLESLTFRTKNGGASWQFFDPPFPPGTQPTSVLADTPSSSWFSLSVTEDYYRPKEILIAKVTDQLGPEVFSIGKTAGWFAGKTQLLRANAQGMWLSTTEVVDGREQGVIFTIGNDGRTWDRLATLALVPDAVCVGEGDVVWLIGRVPGEYPTSSCAEGDLPENPGQNQATGLILSTTDGGRSWDKRRASSLGLLAISVHSGVVHVAGESGQMLRSEDSGLIWRTLPHATSENVYAMSFSAGGRGLAVGDDGTVLVTNSNGAEWSARRHDYDHASFHGIHFSTSNSGVLIDPRGIYLFDLRES